MNGIDRRFLAVLAVAAGVAVLWLFLRRPWAAAEVRECQRLYQHASTAIDTAAIDAQVSLLANPKFHDQYTTCGVLRRLGKL